MKRDASKVIWRTVVFAGAMLGAPACTKTKPATTTPPSNTAQTKPADNAGGNGGTPTNTVATPADPAPNDGGGNPCGAPPPDPRPRGTDDNAGGGMGRGFVLS
jgi:hypothetical protein